MALFLYEIALSLFNSFLLMVRSLFHHLFESGHGQLILISFSMVSWIAVVSLLPKVLSCCTLVIGAGFVVMLSFESFPVCISEVVGGIWWDSGLGQVEVSYDREVISGSRS